jgi:S-(hydroxymethyl)glutathione dehydrogenase / alcohol dehydrogenase
MRAAICPDLHEPLVVEEVELRGPGEHEVVVRIDATAVCITDALAIEGFTLVDRPFINGHAAAGVVEAAGRATSRLRVGERVVVIGSTECGRCFYCAHGAPAACEEIFGGMIPPRAVARRADGSAVHADGGIGTFAERMVYRESHVVAVDTDLPSEHLCLLGCGVTSGLGAVFNIAGVRPGSSVAILGCGHLGLWMVQAARAAGAAQIIAVEPLAQRRALAGELGATDLVDPADGDPVAQVKELTAGRGADFALEAAGAVAAMEQGFLMTRPGGVFVPTGVETMTATVTLPAVEFALAAREIRGSQTGGSHILRDIPRFARMLELGEVDAGPIISRSWTLDEVNEALAAARAREVLTGVIIPG